MEIRTSNIGPARGDVLLGRIDGPGLYFIVGDNAGGKTSILRAMARLQDRKLLRAANTITDGELEAFLEMEPVRCTFRRSAVVAGGMQEPELSGDPAADLPRITEMPAAIETLIQGDHLKDPEARARRRLGALLAYAPLPAADKLVEQLLECLQERSFTEESEFADAAELANALKEEHPADLLAAQDALIKLLHKNARVAEKAAEGYEREADAHAARAKEVVSQSGVEAAVLRQAYPEEAALAAAVAEARAELRGLEQAAATAKAQQARLERLRAQHGERPEANAVTVYEALKLLGVACDEMQEAACDSSAANDGELAPPRWGADLAEQELHVREAAATLRRALDDSEIRGRQQDWDKVEAELAAPVDGPTPAEVASAEDRALKAEDLAARAAFARRFQAIEAEREQSVRDHGRADTLSKDYRKAAKDSWRYLGLAVTEELKLPWLQVDGLNIFVGYVAGSLNNDPELIKAAERAAKVAADDKLSPVSVKRFLLERIREVSAVEWREIDSEERVSTGELHAACLEVMMTRCADLGGFLIVPWNVTGALAQSALESFGKRLEKAELVGLSERPYRKGDNEGAIYLEKV